jgi:hypothetical protein
MPSLVTASPSEVEIDLVLEEEAAKLLLQFALIFCVDEGCLDGLEEELAKLQYPPVGSQEDPIVVE